MIRWIPHKYQLKAVVFGIRNRHAALFLEPGLGKTSIILSIYKCLKRMNKTGPILIVAPLRPMENTWPRELKKWTQFHKLKMVSLHGPDKARLLKTKGVDIFIINPEGLKWLHRNIHYRKKFPFDMLVVDESTKFKNPSSKRFKYELKPLLKRFKRRLILSGTPTPSSLLDLFTQMYIVDLGEALGTKITHYRDKYFKPDGYMGYGWKLLEGAEEHIYKQVAPKVLMMKAEDHLDMPELVFNDIKITFPPKARKQYDEMQKKLFLDIDSHEVRAANVAVGRDKCHQIAQGYLYEDQDPLGKPLPSNKRKVFTIHQEKLKALADLHEELNYKPLLVAYKYYHELVAARKFFKKLYKRELPYIGSGVSKHTVNKIEESWNKGKIPLLFGHPSSMAHGLNFQDAGNDVCYLCIDDNMDDYEQFYRRVYRQGVKGSHVRVHRLLMKDSVDEIILARLDYKGEGQLSFKQAMLDYRNKML